MEKNGRKKVQINEWGPGFVKIEGLTEDERDKIEGMVRGCFWVTGVEKGELKFINTKEELPSPEKDDDMLPFWRKHQDGDGVQLKLKDLDVEEKDWGKHHSPSIFIQHLCGYNYTPDNYRYVAKQLQSYGFECMRSRRGSDGKFWEIWFLPGLWCAKGALEKAIKDKGNRESELGRAIDFLCRNSSFGALDVSVQRAAMTMD